MDSSSKPFWKSKTLWVNFVVLLALLLESIVANQGAFSDAFGPEVGMIILALANILLRFITNTGVTIRGTDG